MATLTVRNLDDEVVRRLRVRAAEHGRSAEAEHREILRQALVADEGAHQRRHDAAARLAEFRRRTGGRGKTSATELLATTRSDRLDSLAGKRGRR